MSYVRNSYKPEDFKRLTIKRNPERISGWSVYSMSPIGRWAGKEHELKQYCFHEDHGYRLPHYKVQVKYGNKEIFMSIAALVWLLYIKEEIPAGYVIDHLDDNPLNNSPGNLCLISSAGNSAKTLMGRQRGVREDGKKLGKYIFD